MRLLSPLAVLAVLALLATPAAARQTSCSPQWQPTFGGQSLGSEFGGPLYASAEFDDAHGPALYVGASSSVLRWDGRAWKLVASTSAGSVLALQVFDDGSGARLYAAGGFTQIGGVAASHIARFDGTSWSALAGGLAGGAVEALCVFDDGSGPALYAGGSISSAGGLPAQNLARWNAAGWSVPASGTNNAIEALCVFDDGSGPALHAGGPFVSAGGVPCSHVAKWTASGWSALGGGVGGGTGIPPTSVDALHVFDDGSGPALFAGGWFTNAGGAPASRIARWDGTSWSALGTGVAGEVFALADWDDGSGNALYVGGTLSAAGGATASGVARWDGTSWTALGAGVARADGSAPKVHTLASVALPLSAGPALFVGGNFDRAGGLPAFSDALWRSSGWAESSAGLDSPPRTLTLLDTGGTRQLFACGSILHAGSTELRALALWNGAHWTQAPPNSVEPFYAGACTAAFDDGSGARLYYSDFGANSMWTFDGAQWSSAVPALSQAHRLFVLQEAGGPQLFALTGGGASTNTIRRRTSGAWTALGSADLDVRALATFDDGSGLALYAGGAFQTLGGQALACVARWNGTSWLPLGSGMAGNAPVVEALEVFDDGTGPALYAAGAFSSAGGTPAAALARWNGSSWSAVGGGLGSAANAPHAYALCVFDDGHGPALHVGGNFTSAGGVATRGLARWDASGWTDLALGGGEVEPTANWVTSLQVLDDGSGSGPALFVVGAFRGAYGFDAFVAKWGRPPGCQSIGSSVCEPGAGGVSACPCANPPASAGRGCDNSAATGGARLDATGSASLANDSVQFTSAGQTPSALSVLLQGSTSSPNGSSFGQGVRCLAGTLRRLYLKSAVGGSIHAPESGDPSVSARCAALGDTIPAGQHRYYAVWYRDPLVLGGCPATSTFNLTQEVDLAWNP